MRFSIFNSRFAMGHLPSATGHWRLALGAAVCAGLITFSPPALAQTAPKRAKKKAAAEAPAKADGEEAGPEPVIPRPAAPASSTPQMIDLPTVLRLAGARNLDVQIARERLAEAKAQHDQARRQFFPWVSPGIGYRRHDGQLQAVEGRVFDASKQSYTVGGALTAQVDLGEAWYRTLAAKQVAGAAEYAVEAERLQAVHLAAVAYFDMVRAQAQTGVAEEAVRVSSEYARQLEAAVETGLVFKGDLHRVRAQTERYRLAVRKAQEQQRLAAARLAQALHLDATAALAAPDEELAPLSLIAPNTALDSLVARAFHLRPELHQHGALLAAAQRERDGAKHGPIIPSLGSQIFLGGLGGGFNDDWGHFDGSAQYQLQLGWRVGPGGLLDRPRSQAAEARVRTAGLLAEKMRDAVLTQVVEAFTRVQSLSDQIATARRALTAAEETARLSRERKQFGVGAVLENILAEQELTQFRNDYLALVADYNKAQYTLAAAIGQLGADAAPRNR